MELRPIEADLLADRLDLGIAFAGAHAAGVDHTALFTEKLGLVVGSDHPVATAAQPLSAAALAGVPLGLLSADFATRLHIDRYFDECGVAPDIAVEANSISALLEFVRRGSLATVLPDAITRAHADLLPIPLGPPCPSARWSYCAATPPTIRPPPARSPARSTRPHATIDSIYSESDHPSGSGAGVVDRRRHRRRLGLRHRYRHPLGKFSPRAPTWSRRPPTRPHTRRSSRSAGPAPPSAPNI